MLSQPDKWIDFSPIRQIVSKKYPIETWQFSLGSHLTGPRGERVPFEINRSASIDENDPNVAYLAFGYIRVGNLAFLDHRLKEVIPSKLQRKFRQNLIYLFEFLTCSATPTHLQFSPLAIYALQSLDLQDKHVLDLGSADGVLSLTARKLGASTVTLVDRDQHYMDWHRLHLAENSFSNERWEFINGDFEQPKHILDKLSATPVDIAVGNIGPWYDNYADLKAIDLAGQIPGIRTYIAGAYAADIFGKSPTLARLALQFNGFSENVREVSYVRTLAIIADRRG